MAQKESLPLGIDIALRLAEEIEAALEEAIPRKPPHDSRQAVSELMEAAASSGAVDQILITAIGLPYAAWAEVYVAVLAKHLAPDPKSIIRIESKLHALIEESIRTALDVFQRALKQPITSPQEQLYRDSRLRDAQQSFDRAWSLASARKARDLLSESEGLEFRMRLVLLRAFCAASRMGGDQEALELRREPLRLLEEAEKDYRARAAKHREKQRWALDLPDCVEKYSFSPAALAYMEFQGQLRRLFGWTQQGRGFWPGGMDVDAAADEWMLKQKARPRAELEAMAAARAEEQGKLARKCEAAAQRYKGISNLIKSALQELGRQRGHLQIPVCP